MNNSAGFTLVELIVTIVLVGILVGSAIPTFNNVINTTQKQVNISKALDNLPIESHTTNYFLSRILS